MPIMSLRTLGRVTPIPDNRFVSTTGLGLQGKVTLFGVLLAVALATSCGGLGTKSNNVTSSGGATLSVTPTAVNFGNTQVGTSKNQMGTLKAGAADITVSSADWSGQGYSLSGITFPVTVPSGKSVSFTVTFDPQTGGTSDGQVSFISNATDSPTVETFSGNGTQSSQHSVDLSWNASPSNVVGYYIYRSTQSGTYSAPLNAIPETSLTFTDGTVESGTTYFYVVAAVDDHSQQSSFSNEARAVIP